MRDAILFYSDDGQTLLTTNCLNVITLIPDHMDIQLGKVKFICEKGTYDEAYGNTPCIRISDGKDIDEILYPDNESEWRDLLRAVDNDDGWHWADAEYLCCQEMVNIAQNLPDEPVFNATLKNFCPHYKCLISK